MPVNSTPTAFEPAVSATDRNITSTEAAIRDNLDDLDQNADFSEEILDTRQAAVFASQLILPLTDLLFNNLSKEDYDAWFDFLKETTYDAWTRIAMELKEK